MDKIQYIVKIMDKKMINNEISEIWIVWDKKDNKLKLMDDMGYNIPLTYNLRFLILIKCIKSELFFCTVDFIKYFKDNKDDIALLSSIIFDASVNDINTLNKRLYTLITDGYGWDTLKSKKNILVYIMG